MCGSPQSSCTVAATALQSAWLRKRVALAIYTFAFGSIPGSIAAGRKGPPPTSTATALVLAVENGTVDLVFFKSTKRQNPPPSSWTVRCTTHCVDTNMETQLLEACSNGDYLAVSVHP